MNKKYVLLLLVALAAITLGAKEVKAQEQLKWLVTFTDKDNVSFNPNAYFDQKTLERRSRLKIPHNQFTDRPVKKEYVDLVRTKVAAVLLTTRWFNGVICYASAEDIEYVKELPCVKEVEFLPRPESALTKIESDMQIRGVDGLLMAQLQRLHASGFGKQKLNGRGIRIAVFDAGFNNYNTHPSVKHLVDSNRIISVKNFVKPGKSIGGHSHGLMVLSCIAGVMKQGALGLATGAEFLLAKTENNFEFLSEEYNWLAAAEWADQNGADIINSSLGYTYHRYLPEEMDGKNSIVSRAANMAASKGITVINSAGNEGGDRWKIIGAPADADSVLSVGGINPRSGLRIDFSSFGPTALNKQKPNVTAYGKAVTASGLNELAPHSGTSFSCPLVTGFAACVAQQDTNLRGMRLFREIEKSGDLYPYFDYAHGYGVPDGRYFTGDRPINTSSYFTLNLEEDAVIIEVDSVCPKSTEEFSESFQEYMFVKVSREDGTILLYRVLDPSDKVPEQIERFQYQTGSLYRYPREDYPGAHRVEVWYADEFITITY